MRARDGKHIAHGALGRSDVLIHPNGRDFFFDNPHSEAFSCFSMKDGTERFVTSLAVAGEVDWTHLSVLPDGRFVAAGSEPRMSPQGRTGAFAGLGVWSFGDPPHVNPYGLLTTQERSGVLNHDARTFRVVRRSDDFMIAVTGAVAFADSDLELTCVVSTDRSEPLWLSVDRADRAHIVVREQEGDFAYWLLSPTGERLATTRWPSVDGAPIAPPVVGPDYYAYLVFSHGVRCFDPLGVSVWTEEVEDAIGGAAVSADGVLLVTKGSSIVGYETLDGAVRSRVLATLEGGALTTAPILTSKGHLLVGSRNHLHTLRCRRSWL